MLFILKDKNSSEDFGEKKVIREVGFGALRLSKI